jgi:hypothetical protein
MVDATNWREFAKGETGEEILRDGEFVRVPIRVTDAAAVNSVRDDRQEFSLGYTAEIRLEPGTYQGEAYDAVAGTFRYNHLAACRAARGGTELRITDERPAAIPAQPKGKAMLVMIDGLQVDVSNPEVASTAIARLVSARDTATQGLNALQEQVNTHATTIAARDAEIVTLKDQVKAAALSPQQLRDAAASYGRTLALAKAVGATVTDAMDEPAIQAAVVAHKMGDAAAAYNAEQNAAAFAALTANVKVDDQAPAPNVDPLRQALSDGKPASLGDAQAAFADARAKRYTRFESAHAGPTAAVN